jgi:hypothetical protein
VKTDLDLDAFLQAARTPLANPEEGKGAVRARLELALGPLAAVGVVSQLAADTVRGPSPAVSASLRGIARYKTGLLLASGFVVGVAAHAGLDVVRSRPAPVAAVQRMAASETSVRAPPAPEAPADSIPVRSVDTLPLVPFPSAAQAPASGASVRPEGRDNGDLAAERLLLESARTALERGDPSHAIAALDRHRQRYPAGQLTEERESLAVYALVAEGKMDEARDRTAAFHRKFQHSLQGPALDALTAEAH